MNTTNIQTETDILEHLLDLELRDDSELSQQEAFDFEFDEIVESLKK